MTLKTRLTIGSVILAVLIVAVISVVDLNRLLQFQYTSTLERAEMVRLAASESVKDALNRPRQSPNEDPLRDEILTGRLAKFISQGSKTISEIVIVAQPSGTARAGTVESRIGQPAPDPRDFTQFVERASRFEKLAVLTRKEPVYFKLDDDLGAGGVVLYTVRLIIEPSLLRRDLLPWLESAATAALIAAGCAVALTLFISTFAFRTLGKIRSMLDLVERGEFDPEVLPPAGKATDELSIMASKVSLLGQRLRGAQFEVSDLRGNIDRLLRDLEDAVFVFNRERKLVFCSGSVERFLGRERVAISGQAIEEVFPESAALGILVGEAATARRAIRNRRLPGPVPVLLSVDPLEGTGSGAGGILVRLRDPEAQRKVGRELQTADRLSAISKVTSGVAHEVKNPLNAILLHVELAKNKLAAGDTDIGPQMEIVSREILRLDRVVRTFLDFTRPVELNLVCIPLQDLVAEVVELARPQANSAKIRIAVRQNVEGVEVRVDRDLIKQAILNVVVNGMQAMSEGGDLTFESSVVKDMAEIRISDTGPGIAPELKDRIFRLYFTTKQGGSGIGLAMTFRILQLHDGTIGFDSVLGKGTTFLIRLPIAV